MDIIFPNAINADSFLSKLNGDYPSLTKETLQTGSIVTLWLKDNLSVDSLELIRSMVQANHGQVQD